MRMAKVTWKGSTLLAPVPPVLVSCRDENADKDNLITVAGTGTLNSDPPKTYISVRPERYSHDIIKQSHTSEMFESVQRGYLAVIPGTKHYPQKEKAGVVNTIITDFLSKKFVNLDRY